jgi:hypothetical protein
MNVIVQIKHLNHFNCVIRKVYCKFVQYNNINNKFLSHNINIMYIYMFILQITHIYV